MSIEDKIKKTDMLNREEISLCYPATVYSKDTKIKLFIIDVLDKDRKIIGEKYIASYNKEEAEKKASVTKYIHGDKEFYYIAREVEFKSSWAFKSIRKIVHKNGYIDYLAEYFTGIGDRAFNAPFCTVSLSIETFEKYIEEYIGLGKDFLTDAKNKLVA